MSNHEPKLLRYLRGHQIQTNPLIKTIEQCGEDFLRDPCLLEWLESLPWIVRYTDTSYVVHAGIRPDRPINRQYKDHCIYIRIWNRKTKRISNEAADPWWCEFAYLYDSRKHHSPPFIKIFFGHQLHEKALVSHWACALDGGVVFGGRLQGYVENKGIVEINANMN
jgi:hypothetical protein